MTTPHPQPDSPPLDVERLQARIAELEAERVRLQLALYESRDRLETTRRAAAAWKRAAKDHRAYWLMKCDTSDEWQRLYLAARRAAAAWKRAARLWRGAAKNRNVANVYRGLRFWSLYEDPRP